MGLTAVFVSLACLSCGGAQRPQGAGSPAEAAAAPSGSGSSAADAVQLCHVTRTDYPFVASYRCADGSVPLRGDPAAGAAARLGNVGAGPDGHIVDLYEIPCPGGAVRVFVDSYHCGSGIDAEIDPMNLSEDQLAAMGQRIRALETDLSGEDSLEVRRALLAWVMETPQVQVVVCPDLLSGVTEGDHPTQPMIAMQLALSLAAATIEARGRPMDRVAINFSAMLGVLRFYEALVSRIGPEAAHPRMDELLRMREAGALEAFVRSTTALCEAGR